jgi:hypothetical protein
MTVDQMKSGFKYDVLRQAISVVITDHTLLPDEGGYMNCYELRNRKSGKLFTDLQQYAILELPKVPEEDDGSPCGRFCNFSNAGGRRSLRC